MPRIKERFATILTQRLTATSGMAGVATINSGTSVASVAAANAVSGAIILTQAMGFSLATNSANPSAIFTVPASVANGAFIITTIGSVCPPAALNVAWAIIRRA